MSTRASDAAAVVGATMLILLPLLVNGFPLVYSDTGTYLRSAFEGFVPTDRPYWYGGFIRITSLNGVWITGTTVTQSLLCAIYLFLLIRTALNGRAARITLLVFCSIAGVFSGLGWYAGQLMPDIFTPIGAMAMYLLVAGEGRWPARAAHVAVVALCAWSHSSNLLILPLVGLAAISAVAGRSMAAWRRPLARWALATVCAWGGLYTANGLLEGDPYLSKGNHVFLMGRLAETGMLEPLLRAECPQRDWRICQHVDSLPRTARAFIWDDKSPLHHMGGWDSTRAEYGEIVRVSFGTPERLWHHAAASATSTAEQLSAWRIGEEIESHWYREPWSAPAMAIARVLPGSLPAFNGAMQQGGRSELSLSWPDAGYRLLLATSLLVVAVHLVRRRRPAHPAVSGIVVLAMAATIIDAWVCASLSEVLARYLARASWLLLLAATVVVARWKTVPGAASADRSRR